MVPLWKGRAHEPLDDYSQQLNSAIGFDQRLYPYDIQGSVAHTQMLHRQGILTMEEASLIVAGLSAILSDMNAGELRVDPEAEDIHTFVEQELTRRIGDAGKKLHTGRSRNDQVVLDMRLYVRDALITMQLMIEDLQDALEMQAQQHEETLMPGYTHLQPAQPITLAQHLRAYVAMVERDKDRLSDCIKRVNQSPLGAGALAGSTFQLDRQDVAETLAMDGVMENTLDAVSSRDFVIETLSHLSILMMHMSRFCEELILWSSQEFGFVTLHDAYTTGSSMMPQKKNPDVAELIRGKTGRVYGNLVTMLTVMKALPLAYNKDMQEDKEALFDTLDTVHCCLGALTGMVSTMTPNVAQMASAAYTGFLNATDLADYLARKGLPFREAYALVGAIVDHCLTRQHRLETLPLSDYQSFSPHFGPDLYEQITLQACIQARKNEFPAEPVTSLSPH